MSIKRKITTYFLLLTLAITNIGFLMQYDSCMAETFLVFNILNNDCNCENVIEPTDECCSSESENLIPDKGCEDQCMVVNDYKKLDTDQIFTGVISFEQSLVSICNTLNEESNLSNLNNLIIKNNRYLELDDWGKSLIISHHKIKIPAFFLV